MSSFLFLETILFPLPNLLLLTDDNSFDLDSVARGLATSQADLSEKTRGARQKKIRLQHNCIAAQFIFNCNTSVTGHELVMILRPLRPLRPRS